MSKTTIIYAHPYEKSFNHAILERVQALLDAKGQEYRLIDLYADGFNPVYTKEELALFREGKALDPLVLQYQEALKDSKRLIFIFPIWWADMPAIVKGFLDKVLLRTFAYMENRVGLLEGRLDIDEALVISTSTAGGARQSTMPCLRTSVRRLARRCANQMGAGMRSGVSEEA